MTDFSDKYKKAADSIGISPDFNERTAEKMAKLRDSQAADGARKKIFRILPMAATAAAACIVLALAAGNKELPLSDDIIAASQHEETTAAETVSANDITGGPYENDPIEAQETIHQTEADIIEEAVTESVVMGNSPEDMGNEADNISGYSSPEENSPVESTPQTSEKNEPELFDAEYVPPTNNGTNYSDSEENDFETDGDLDAGDGLDGDGSGEITEPSVSPEYGDNDMDNDCDSIAPAAISPDSYSGRSAYDEFSQIRNAMTFAVITPLFEDYIENTGTIAAYDAVTVTDSDKLSPIFELLSHITEKDAEECSSYEYRYIIDLADDQGNSLRIYCGKNSIRFSTQYGDNFCYALTDEESSTLEKLLFDLICE